MSTVIHKTAAAFVSQKNRLQKDESGQTMVEYFMMIILVALAIFLAGPDVKSSIVAVFTIRLIFLLRRWGRAITTKMRLYPNER
jgi:Flp pilus assembly pilin Flp